MKDIIGEFTGNSVLHDDGVKVANDILDKVNSGELKITDDYFNHFLCCIFAEGNFEFLRILARNWYPDTRQEIILNFIDLVEKTTLEGQKSLHESVAAKKMAIIEEILGGL